MDSDEVLTAELRISKLMNVGHGGTGHRAHRTIATRVITQAFFTVVSKDCLAHETLMYADSSVRTVVIVNRRFLPGSPANHKHFNRFIATDSMTPIITFLKSDVILKILRDDLDVRKPGIYLFERRRSGLAVQVFDQL